MPKGIVMEVEGLQVIVLTSEGTFERVPLEQAAQVGEEITFESKTKRLKGLTKRGLTKWASIAACFLLTIGTWSYLNVTNQNQSQNQVYAYVGIDINPSVELGINQAGSVLSADALNDDAKQVLTGLSLQGDTIEKAVSEIALSAAKKGFVHQNSDIVITTSPASVHRQQGNSSTAESSLSAEEAASLNNLEQAIIQATQKSIAAYSPTVLVDGFEVSPSFYKTAKDAGLSPAKYAFYLKAQHSGYPVTIEELKQYSRFEVAQRHGFTENILQGETEQSIEVAGAHSSPGKSGSDRRGDQNKQQSDSSAAPTGTSNSLSSEPHTPAPSSTESHPAQTRSPASKNQPDVQSKGANWLEEIKKRLKLEQDNPGPETPNGQNHNNNVETDHQDKTKNRDNEKDSNNHDKGKKDTKGSSNEDNK